MERLLLDVEGLALPLERRNAENLVPTVGNNGSFVENSSRRSRLNGCILYLTGRKLETTGRMIAIITSSQDRTGSAAWLIGYFATFGGVLAAMTARIRGILWFRPGRQSDEEGKSAVLTTFRRQFSNLCWRFPNMTPVILRMTTVSHCAWLE
jgi:hypothetical protein